MERFELFISFPRLDLEYAGQFKELACDPRHSTVRGDVMTLWRVVLSALVASAVFPASAFAQEPGFLPDWMCPAEL